MLVYQLSEIIISVQMKVIGYVICRETCRRRGRLVMLSCMYQHRSPTNVWMALGMAREYLCTVLMGWHTVMNVNFSP